MPNVRNTVGAAALIILIFLGVFGRRDAVAQDEKWLCDVLEQSVVARSGWAARWIGYPEGWADMPADLGAIPIDLLPINESFSSAYYLMFSASEMELWIFPFWTLDVSADPNGDHLGNHGLCQVMVYELKGE